MKTIVALFVVVVGCFVFSVILDKKPTDPSDRFSMQAVVIGNELYPALWDRKGAVGILLAKDKNGNLVEIAKLASPTGFVSTWNSLIIRPTETTEKPIIARPVKGTFKFFHHEPFQELSGKFWMQWFFPRQDKIQRYILHLQNDKITSISRLTP